jgi:branched-subunit amino acid transport protein
MSYKSVSKEGVPLFAVLVRTLGINGEIQERLPLPSVLIEALAAPPVILTAVLLPRVTVPEKVGEAMLALAVSRVV